MHPAVGRVCTGLLGRAPLRRSFASAEGAVDGTKRLVLSFVSPYEKILTAVAVSQVNVKTTEGDLGILAGHVPSLLQLTPGLLQVITRGPLAGDLERKLSYFVSGGFAMVNPDSTMEVSAMEAAPVDQLDEGAVAAGLAEASRKVAAITSASSDIERAEAAIQHQVYAAMAEAIAKTPAAEAAA